jgi:CHAD domain-containing protein
MPLEAGDTSTPPVELTHIVTALVRGAAIEPVATLRTERTPFLLRADDDRLIAELVDDVVSVLDGDRVAGRFREIEVEAREAESDDLDRVLAVLVAAGAEPGTTSKAAHALGPRATAPPDVPAPVTGSPRDPASVAVHSHLVTQTRRLLLNDVRMRRDLPDSVHQMRVAARRLRSSLRTFRPLLDAEWADGLREDLGWVASELGSVRDTEVLLKRLDAHCELIDDADAREAARREITTVLGDRLVTARADALAALNSPRYVALLEHVVTAVRVPPFTVDAAAPAKVVLPALSWDAWRRLRRSASELDHDIAAEHWHRARIIAKRARYAAEAIEPVFGNDAAVLAQSLEQVTELLGEHQDAAGAQAAIAELAARPGIDGRTGWGLGLLHGVERDAERQAREDFADVWANTERVHRRSRLR